QVDANHRDKAFEEHARLNPPPPRTIQQTRTKPTRTIEPVPTTEPPRTQEQPPVITTVIKDPKPERTARTLRILGRHTEQLDRRDNLRKMDNELQGRREAATRPPARCTSIQWPSKLPAVNICLIGPVGFQRNQASPGAIIFITSLCEIDQLIQEKQETLPDPELTDEELVDRKLPAQYKDFQGVFSKAASNRLPPHRPYDHKIELEQSKDLDLAFSPLRQQTAEELLATKKYIVENLGNGFIEPSQAPFAAPILFVRKADGSLRLCIDFRKLNNLTKKDRYPLPLLDETLARMGNARIFTKLDIRQAFHRIHMHPDSEDLTTFRTRYGTYKCKVMPFGLTNGPATWQRFMNDTLFDHLDDFCTAYLDDIMIYSKNEQEHEEHVQKVLDRLRSAGLQADIRKSEFHVTRTKYLGFIISTDGIEADPEKTAVISQWQPPRTVRGIQSFLGFCNFYRRFIQGYSQIARPLNRLVRKDQPFNFDKNCWDAFETLKERLISAPVLIHYDRDLPIQLETDASDGVVAGVLSQYKDDRWHPVAYYSRTMIAAELNYPIHDKELLAIIACFVHWRVELVGTPQAIRVISDHQALEYFMSTKALTARQARWADTLSQHSFQIQYQPGTPKRADALTRREQDIDGLALEKVSLRTQTLLKSENLDPRIVSELPEASRISSVETPDRDFDLIDSLLQANRTNEALQEYRDKAQLPDQGNDWTLENGLLTYQDRLVVPEETNLRTRLIKEVHAQRATAHPGRTKTTKILCDRYYWPGMTKDIAQFVRNCDDCRRASIPRDKTPGLLKPLPIPERPWQHISMDFHEMPLDRNGYNMVLVLVDCFGKRPLTFPCRKTITAKELAQLYIDVPYRIYGPPVTIVSDRGPQFISAFWKEFTGILGIKLKLSTAYHPQTDGQTEIVNQYLDQRLRPFVNYFQDNWSELLPIMDYAGATLPHSSTGFAPIQLEMGYLPRTSFDWDQPKDPQTVWTRLS